MREYQSLSALTREYADRGARDFPSPTKIFSGLNAGQAQFFRRAMADKTSAVYQAVASGRRVHRALETGVAGDGFSRAVLRRFRREIGCDIDETWGQEGGLISLRRRFRGRFDGVGVFRGRETVWDYKKTNRPKTASGVRNYLRQCAAYAIAHDEMYDTRIRQLAVMIVHGTEAGELGTQVFTLEGRELEAAQRGFLADRRAYRELAGV